MKKPRMSLVAMTTVVVTLLSCGWLFRDRLYDARAQAFVKRTDVDLNSGDLRYRVCVYHLPVKSKISQSSLSREVRRLGIAIPSQRAWTPAFVQRHEPGHVDYVYGFLVANVFDKLVRILNETNTPDASRRVILVKFMTSLRTQDAWEAQERAYAAMAKIAEEHGLDIFTPEFVEQLKESDVWTEDENRSGTDQDG